MRVVSAKSWLLVVTVDSVRMRSLLSADGIRERPWGTCRDFCFWNGLKRHIVRIMS